jgi:hypothetical protein
MDGGYVIVPQSGMYNFKGEWILENEGFTPDIIKDTTPVDQVKGLDPQLDLAIELLTKEIAENPVNLLPLPPGPVNIK